MVRERVEKYNDVNQESKRVALLSPTRFCTGSFNVTCVFVVIDCLFCGLLVYRI